MDVVEANGVTTTSGDVFGYSFIMFIVIYIIMIIMIIRDIKNIKNKKYIPILSLILTSLTSFGTEILYFVVFLLKLGLSLYPSTSKLDK